MTGLKTLTGGGNQLAIYNSGRGFKWPEPASNPGPPDCESDALTTRLRCHFVVYIDFRSFLFTKVFFQDVFAEPESSHSIDGVWRTSFRAFVLTKHWCYRIITAICGVPTAILCGIYFACLSFDYIWCIMPCLRAYTIELQFLGKLFSLCVRSFFDPFFESVGKIFGGVKIERKTFQVWCHCWKKKMTSILHVLVETFYYQGAIFSWDR